MTKTAEPRCVIFAREGRPVSVADQLEACGEWATKHGYTAVDPFSGPSRTTTGWAIGRKGDPELFDAVMSLNEGDTLIAHHWQAISSEPRAVGALWDILRSGFEADLVFVSDGDEELMRLHAWRDSFIEARSMARGLRKRRRRAAEGADPDAPPYTGGPRPYGWVVDRKPGATPHYVREPNEQLGIAVMVALAEAGVSQRMTTKCFSGQTIGGRRSTNEAALTIKRVLEQMAPSNAVAKRLLSGAGVPTMKGRKTWQPNAVMRTLRRVNEAEKRRERGGAK